MSPINNKSGIERTIAENNFVVVFFHTPGCAVCKSLMPILEKMVAEQLSDVVFIAINTDTEPELAVSKSIYTSPVVLFFAGGKEYIREVRFIDTALLIRKIRRIIDLYTE